MYVSVFPKGCNTYQMYHKPIAILLKILCASASRTGRARDWPEIFCRGRFSTCSAICATAHADRDHCIPPLSFMSLHLDSLPERLDSIHIRSDSQSHSLSDAQNEPFSSNGIAYRLYAGESDLPDIMALVQYELSEPYVSYTYRYFLHEWYVTFHCRHVSHSHLIVLPKAISLLPRERIVTRAPDVDRRSRHVLCVSFDYEGFRTG